MARYVLAFLVAFSLAFSGVANAMAALDCPYLKSPVTHHCCPPTSDKHQDKTTNHSKSLDCRLGQACRTVPVVAPLMPVLARTTVAPVDARIMPRDEAGRPSPLFAHWKPPRSA